ncbi:MAG TPA: M1 family metallopeptidase [Gemmatimonadota bacterium]|nr:M1 family metallopeptidase [Gemmatimonadota bacterium]
MSVARAKSAIKTLLLGGLCLASAGAPRVEAPNPAIDVLGYTVDIDLLPERSAFQAATAIELVLTQAAERVRFDLVGLTVDSVTQGGAAVRFQRDEGGLFVSLRAPAAAGDTVTVTVFYGGTPRDGLIFRRNPYGAPTAFADNWPDRARQWLPSNDHPSDKATVELRVRAPAAWNVVGVGRLVSQEAQNDGRVLTIWSTDRAIPVYSMVFGAGELVIGNAGSLGCDAPARRCIPITWWLYPEDAANGARIFRRAQEAVVFFDSLVGPFPYEKLALVQSSTRYGGMENASAIFLYEGVGRALDADGLVVHEIAHQWFGDAVTQREWPHLWLSEGLATYFTSVFFEFRDGAQVAQAMRARGKQGYLAAPQAVASPVIGAEPANLRELLNANNYQKAAWVLHMLRRLVGDEKFFAGVRRYYAEYRHETALTEDFQRIMEEESGEELGWFFQQWLYRPGYPQVEANFTWDPSLNAARLNLKQVQDGPAFRIPLTYEMYMTGLGQKAQNTVWMEERERSSLVMLPTRPGRIVLDPNDDLLGVAVVVP